MATRYWIGSDGDWNNTANWSGATVPVSNDTVIFPEEIITGPSSNMDQGGVDLDLLYTDPGFTGNIGSTSTPLLIAADLVRHESPGDLFYECDLDGVSALVTDEMIIMSTNPGAKIEIGSNPSDVGTISKIIALRGNVLIKQNISYAAGSRIECGHMGNLTGDLTLEIAEGAGVLANLLVWGGNVTSLDEVTAYFQSEGFVRQDKDKITTGEVRGGTLQYDHRAVSGDSTTLRMHGGFLDLSKTADEKTITTLQTHVGSTITYNPQLHTFTTWRYLGGEVRAR